ncbi:hypothetical protein PGT21_013701 [Puccinia graminis f. sp. tritici]|uniref:Uncharacterized protein n=2 Tax=Puccinia graminis f. sp. tritici TaxID=56615 RepID=E3JX47_PUCGT|nr:uncharacterized protein PGTG_02083 [Puccinia graminis f. sp. tritici CRL 75-36-700-3]EFP76622.2 hypothetical protein PGTG_02083 [Puccinia graminis f. sp. tritici CRL 75-36-700-3]KAA1095151.1 hypothetical protein PGT21_036114 [Puccinia graminis f. sp. tritici]KAA1119052.1 hypothetical protein PGT21_013701 [Puccinia graminis f. sp. tritici]KAA1121422.1 hypothetical protein PGTUg99_023550 [Puccinia graminis f. sp. tritici]
MIKFAFLCLAMSIAIVEALGGKAYHVATVKIADHDYKIFDCTPFIQSNTKTKENDSDIINADPEMKEDGSNIFKNDAQNEENGNNIMKKGAETATQSHPEIEEIGSNIDPETEEHGSDIIKNKTGTEETPSEDKQDKKSPYTWVQFANTVPQTELQIYNPSRGKVVNLVTSPNDHCNIGILEEQPWIVATSRKLSWGHMPAFPPLNEEIKERVMEYFKEHLATGQQNKVSEEQVEVKLMKGISPEGTVANGNLPEEEMTWLEEYQPEQALQKSPEKAQKEEDPQEKDPQQEEAPQQEEHFEEKAENKGTGHQGVVQGRDPSEEHRVEAARIQEVLVGKDKSKPHRRQLLECFPFLRCGKRDSATLE